MQRVLVSEQVLPLFCVFGSGFWEPSSSSYPELVECSSKKERLKARPICAQNSQLSPSKSSCLEKRQQIADSVCTTCQNIWDSSDFVCALRWLFISFFYECECVFEETICNSFQCVPQKNLLSLKMDISLPLFPNFWVVVVVVVAARTHVH